MSSPRLIVAGTVLCAASLLAGCGGDDDGTPSTGGSAPTASFTKNCTVKVKVSGPVKSSWRGKGTVTDGGGPITYTAVHGADRVTAYYGTDDIPTNASVTVDGATYTTTDPSKGLDIAKDGTGAEIDADTIGVDGAGPHLAASFTCG